MKKPLSGKYIYRMKRFILSPRKNKPRASAASKKASQDWNTAVKNFNKRVAISLIGKRQSSCPRHSIKDLQSEK